MNVCQKLIQRVSETDPPSNLKNVVYVESSQLGLAQQSNRPQSLNRRQYTAITYRVGYIIYSNAEKRFQTGNVIRSLHKTLF